MTSRTGTVVRAQDEAGVHLGYAQTGGVLGGEADAAVMTSEEALETAADLARMTGVGASGVELLEMIDGRLIEDTALPLAGAPRPVGLLEALGMVSPEQGESVMARVSPAVREELTAEVRKALADFRDPRTGERLQLKGVDAAHPPRHESGGLT